MLNDPIVIVGAARTPMGGFQGDFASLSASDLGAVAIRAAVERAGIAARRRAGSDHGQRAAGRAGPGARAAGVAQGGPAAVDRLHDRQQDVRLGDEGGDARARPDRRRDERDHGRGRHGEHDQRAVPDAEGARGLPDGPPDGLRPHVPRRPRGRLRQGPADGHVRRGLRGEVQLHARGAGRVRADVAVARARRQQRRHVRLGDRARSPSPAARATSSSTTTSSRRRPRPTRSRR